MSYKHKKKKHRRQNNKQWFWDLDTEDLRLMMASHEAELKVAGYTDRQLSLIKDRVARKHDNPLSELRAMVAALGVRVGGVRGARRQMGIVQREIGEPEVPLSSSQSRELNRLIEADNSQ